MENKENIYDNEIAPLMQQIIDICKRENMPLFAEVQLSDNKFCTSCIYPDIHGRNVTTNLYNVLSKCRQPDGVNIDDFYFYISKHYKNKSSIVMQLLGNKVDALPSVSGEENKK